MNRTLISSIRTRIITINLKKMDKSFNELFNEFFKKNNIKPEDKLGDNLRGFAKKMIDILSNSNIIDGDMEKELDEQLGKPDKIEFFNENNLYYEKRIWHTPHGDITKLLATNDPTLLVAPKPKKSLQLELKEAIEAEQYEKAAAIRDLIDKEKEGLKEKKKAVKAVKKNESKTKQKE